LSAIGLIAGSPRFVHNDRRDGSIWRPGALVRRCSAHAFRFGRFAAAAPERRRHGGSHRRRQRRSGVEPRSGDHMRCEMKRVDGIWKIDDFRNLESYARPQPSVKTLFNDPIRYAQ
jgi:hypothetical protein